MAYREELMELIDRNKPECERLHEEAIEKWLKEEGEAQLRASIKDPPLVNFDDKRKQLKNEMLEAFDVSKINEAVVTAFTAIHDNAHNLLTSEENTRMNAEWDALAEKLRKGELGDKSAETFQERFNVPDDLLDCFQKIANHLFEKGKVEDAQSIYSILVFINPKRVNYYIGLGHCFVALGQDRAAAGVYLGGVMADTGNPIPYLLAANSCIDCKEVSTAKEIIETAEEVLHGMDHEEGKNLLRYVKNKLGGSYG